MIEQIVKKIRPLMDKIIVQFQEEIGKIRVGRASAGLVEDIPVSYYGSMAPLKSMASISTPDANLIVVQPWDSNSLRDIETAIRNSEIEFSPVNDGRSVRIAIPPMTQERREEFVKSLSQKTEAGRVALRNVRKDAWEEIQNMQKKAEISQDDLYRGEELLNKTIEEYNLKLAQLTEAKEKEIRTV
ncbi:MAG: ribosome recycling factor [Patescibacteria group bacterium]|jgi:ribosome recycling factor